MTRQKGTATVNTMTLDDFQTALRAQGVKTHEDAAFVCPMCKTVQSSRDLIRCGAGETFDDVERYLGFSCVGRWTGAGAPRKKPDGKPCNWTLGGLLSLHKLEVITPDDLRHPRFELATPEQAQTHALEHA